MSDEQWIVYGIVWVVLAIIPAAIADAKARSALPWFLYGLAIWPLALIHVLLARRGDAYQCKQCMGFVPKAARKCMHCGHDFYGATT